MVAALDLDKSPLERLENQSINIYRCQDDLDKEKRLIQSVCAGGKKKRRKKCIRGKEGTFCQCRDKSIPSSLPLAILASRQLAKKSSCF